MNKILSNFLLFFIAVLTIAGCGGSLDNSIVFKNMSSGSIFINFRGSVTTVPAGQSAEIKDIPNGTYTYSTTYEIPAGALSSNTQGDVSGSVNIKPGTKILILYSSTFISGNYTLYATLSNSDNQNSPASP